MDLDHLLENDTFLKIISVIVALFLWVQVTGTHAGLEKNKTIGPVSLQYSSPTNPALTVMNFDP
ncbi:MAG: hypothetical protein OWS74_01855, partial [Firmicutes bacterium]|nr:hypothetical protein [Bacillota bacterium]